MIGSLALLTTIRAAVTGVINLIAVFNVASTVIAFVHCFSFNVVGVISYVSHYNLSSAYVNDKLHNFTIKKRLF